MYPQITPKSIHLDTELGIKWMILYLLGADGSFAEGLAGMCGGAWEA